MTAPEQPTVPTQGQHSSVLVPLMAAVHVVVVAAAWSASVLLPAFAVITSACHAGIAWTGSFPGQPGSAKLRQRVT